MGAAAPTFEFFKDVPQDESLSEEVAAYQKDFNDCKGLIPEQAMPHMLGVSRQRWHVMKSDYGFQTYTHFGRWHVDKKPRLQDVGANFVEVQPMPRYCVNPGGKCAIPPSNRHGGVTVVGIRTHIEEV